MRQAIELIVQNAGRFPEFRYYIGFMKKAERNLSNQPDVCIEICKSLLEGVSKSIIERLDETAARTELDKLDVGKLAKRAADLLRQNDDVVEDDFITRSTSLAYALGALRNARGDVSHGKAVPKTTSSNDRLSAFSMQMAESVICYMLDAFFALPDKAAAASPIVEAEDTEPKGLPEVSYEDNEAFNQFLDDAFPLEGKLFYSFALYQLYYEDYLIRLAEFQNDLEAAEE